MSKTRPEHNGDGASGEKQISLIYKIFFIIVALGAIVYGYAFIASDAKWGRTFAVENKDLPVLVEQNRKDIEESLKTIAEVANANKDLPVLVEQNRKDIERSLKTIAEVARANQNLPVLVEQNRKDLDRLHQVPERLAVIDGKFQLVMQTMETQAKALGRIDKQVNRNTTIIDRSR